MGVLNQVASWLTRVRFLGVAAVVMLALLSARAQEAGGADASAFDKQAIPLRTALHYNPSLGSALDALVSLYQKADRTEELIALYQAHIAQYPEDAGAHAVLIRILNKLQRSEAAELTQATAQRLSDSSEIQYLLYEFFKERRDERALAALSAAIDLETDATRRDERLTELLEQAGEANGRALATKHLVAIQQAPEQTAAGLLKLAERMHAFGFDPLALETLKLAEAKSPTPEVKVEQDLLTAKVLAALGDRKKAGDRLDALLARLAPDYWRRAEITALRVHLLANEMDRDDLLAETKAKYEASPKDESIALNYAELLAASDERRKALELLITVAEDLPKSARVEKEAITLFDQLGDEEGLAEFLESRIALDADRPDLIWRLVKIDFLRGRADTAEANLSKALNALETDSDRGTRLLEMARFLRKSSLHREAAKLFERVIAAAPERLDILRELAETRLALKDRIAARADLSAAIDAGNVKMAPVESVVDLVQFMIEQNFLREARETLLARKDVEPQNFEIRLLLASVLGKVGERQPASDLLVETRELADTTSRYRDWLETNLSVAEIFDSAALFFDDEQVRLLTGPESQGEWSAERIERFLAFCEIGERGDLSDRVTQVLRNQLEDPALPTELSIRLRSLLVKSLERRPEFATEMEFQLKKLAEEDAPGANDYALRRVLLYHSLQRSDLVSETLEEIDFEKVQGIKTLRSAYSVLLENGFTDAAKIALRRVTEKEPDELVNWEKRLSLLAALGDEREFRLAVRELQAESEKVNLDGPSSEKLRVYLLDSYWRSIAKLVSAGGQEAFASAIELLDSVERESVGPEDRLWSLWTRAWILNALGQKPGRDEAIEEILALGSRSTQGSARIVFPDGLAISLTVAVDLLRQPSDAIAGDSVPVRRSEGPLFDLEIGWAFEVDPGATVTSIRPAGDTAVLVLDDRGTVYRVDRKTGRLVWREAFGVVEELPAVEPAIPSGAGLQIQTGQFSISQQGAAITVQQLIAPYQTATLTGSGVQAGRSSPDVSTAKQVRPLTVSPGGAYFFLTFGPEVRCYDSETRALVWSSDIRAQSGIEGIAARDGQSLPGVHLRVVEGRLLCFAPSYGSVSAFDLGSGKLAWSRQLSNGQGLDDNETLFSLNTGADFGANHSLIFGRESRIIDSKSGETIWTFDGSQVRRFPIRLRKVREDGEVSEDITLPKDVAFRDHFDLEGESIEDFVGTSGALVAPAVAWSASRLKGRTATNAIVEGDRLLLMEESGVREISLRLPLASKFHSVKGTVVGLVGQYLWLVEGTDLVRVALDSQTVERISAAAVAGNESGVRAVLSGSRLYVTGGAGLLTLNAWSANVLAQTIWPEAFSQYASRRPAEPLAPGETFQNVWQGVVRKVPNAPNYAYPIRDVVDGDWLYTLVNDRSFVAVRSRDAASASR